MKVKNLKELRKVVCSIGICEVCCREFPEDMICPHHCKTKGSRPDLILETDNCISVCQMCHNKIHMGLIKVTKIKDGLDISYRVRRSENVRSVADLSEAPIQPYPSRNKHGPHGNSNEE